MEKISFDRWASLEERLEIGDRYSKRFQGLIESAKMVQEHPFVHSFSFIRGHELTALTRIPRFQDYRARLCPFDDATEKICVSYRWLSPDHPDPDGRQLRLLQRHVKPDAYYWIDYACLPQPPMDEVDEALLRESLSRLTTLLYKTKMLVLRHRNDGYTERAWCFFEILAAHTVVREHLEYVFEDERDAGSIRGEAQNMVQQALVGGLPGHLKVTNPADLPTISMLTDVTCAFFELNVLMHYMRLGQHVSDKKVYAFGEPPIFSSRHMISPDLCCGYSIRHANSTCRFLSWLSTRVHTITLSNSHGASSSLTLSIHAGSQRKLRAIKEG